MTTKKKIGLTIKYLMESERTQMEIFPVAEDYGDSGRPYITQH